LGLGGWLSKINIHRFDKIIVENNPDRKGILDFNGIGLYSNNGGRDPQSRGCDQSKKFEVYIDGLEIAEGNALIIAGAYASQGFYLRDTEANKSLISKIGFEYGGSIWKANAIPHPWNGYLRVNMSWGEAWTPPPIPEPSTYGAILGAAGLGLYLLRKKRGQL